MARFTITRLVGDRAIVKGTDVLGNEGQCLVSTEQWDSINANSAFSQAEADFTAAVEEFFKPLTEAAEKMHTSVKKPADSVSYVVLDEGEEATPGRRREVVSLTHDSVVLRLVESGNTDRLVWVDDSTLEVLEADTPLPLDDDVVVADAD